MSGSVDTLSAEYPVLVPQETAFFGRGDTLPQLGNSPEATRAAFENEVGAVSSAIRLGNGSAFLQVLEERPAGIPDFEEVKEQVRSQLKERKVMELARVQGGCASRDASERGGGESGPRSS